MTDTMQALSFAQFGPPSVLSLEARPMPQLEPGWALVEVRAAAINPSDVKNVAGAFGASLPRIPGRDYAGVVVAGDGRVGQEVWGSGAGFGVSRDGTHAQYLAVGLDSLSEKPSHLSMAEAAAVGVPYLTAWSALVVAADIQAGETVLVTGALGAVGRAATQVAHWKKARVIGAGIAAGVSGADAFVVASHQELAAEVLRMTDGRGVDLVLDAVGGPMFEPCLQALRVGGRQVAITSVGTGRVEFSLVDFYHRSQRLIGLDTLKLTGPQIAKIMDALREGFESGDLSVPAPRTWPLGEAIQAYEAVRRGAGPVKHVLAPHGTAVAGPGPQVI